jgi:hypothetical protein
MTSISHTERRRTKREDMEKEAVFDITAGGLKVETFSTTKKHGFL